MYSIAERKAKPRGLGVVRSSGAGCYLGLGFRVYIAKDVFINQERKLGARRR